MVELHSSLRIFCCLLVTFASFSLCLISGEHGQTFPVKPPVKDFGKYIGHWRQSKNLNTSHIHQASQSVSENKNAAVQKRSKSQRLQPKKLQESQDKKNFHLENFGNSSDALDEFDMAQNQYTGNHHIREYIIDLTKRISPIIRYRPKKIRKSTTTSTTHAPMKIGKSSKIKTRSHSSFVKLTKSTLDLNRKDYPSRPINRYPTPQPYTQASKCDPRKCLLPDCRCGGTDIPEGLRVSETPQLVLLTFDDAVNIQNADLYDELFDSGRVNPNECPILSTFYVSHEWTDYGQVQTLYSKGHEFASHSITHSDGAKMSKDQWMREIHGQREILHQYGGIKMEDIRGMRAPFLQPGGNEMFEMLFDSNFTYDSSLPVYDNDPPFWPYTLDYAQNHACMIHPCPTKSYPGLWEVGMVMWIDLKGGRCSMVDACSSPEDENALIKMLMKNFNRHYKSNRAPLGLFYHSAWFTSYRRRGFMKFIDKILQKDDVWLVTNWQLIQWMRKPTPNNKLKNFKPFNCQRTNKPPACLNPTVCSVQHQGQVRYMRTCQPCPVKYPWIGNTGYDKV